jgi:hypothetical protein
MAFLDPMIVEPQRTAQSKGSEEESESPSTSSHSTPEPSSPTDSSSSILDETVKGIKEVASVSFASFKDWVRCSQPNRTTAIHGDDEKSWFAQGNDMNNRNQAAARKALSDLMSPFMACHGSRTREPREATQTSKQQDAEHHSHLSELRDRIFMLHHADSETVASMDTGVEDEMMQLHRLTSWGTNATNETLDTDTQGTDRGVITDDDGHVIPPVLLETAQKRREKRKRIRVVRFDYPPISSLRECPRHDPDDLADLFFTEEELDEIEADRTSAYCADDIEIVAVASAKSTELSMDQSPRQSTSGDSSDKKEDRFGSVQSTPRLQRKPRSSSPHPHRPAKGTWTETPSDGQSVSRGAAGDPRLIKGVQIYLRERSTGKGTNKR